MPEPGEDSQTNPGCYGKALAEWISAALKSSGTEVEDVIAEDWGWCVVVERRAYLLWVGCGNVQEEPTPKEITWHCLVHVEVPFWKFWLKWSHSSEMKIEVARLNSLLEAALANEPRIMMVEEP